MIGMAGALFLLTPKECGAYIGKIYTGVTSLTSTR